MGRQFFGFEIERICFYEVKCNECSKVHTTSRSFHITYWEWDRMLQVPCPQGAVTKKFADSPLEIVKFNFMQNKKTGDLQKIHIDPYQYAQNLHRTINIKTFFKKT